MATPSRMSTPLTERKSKQKEADESWKRERDKVHAADIAKTARLKAMRLAKEADDKAAADAAGVPVPAKPKRLKARPAVKSTTGSKSMKAPARAAAKTKA